MKKTLATILLLFTVCRGFHYGSGTCNADAADVARGMSISTLKGTGGYTIDIPVEVATLGDVINVTISNMEGVMGIKGMLLYAESSNGKRIGEFIRIPQGFRFLVPDLTH